MVKLSMNCIMFIILFFSAVLPTFGLDTPTTNIIFVGDSITEGSIGSSYIDELAKISYPWGSENFSLINSGANGYRTSYFYNNDQNIIRKIFDKNAHFVVIFIGMNDVSDGTPEVFNTHYRYLIDGIYRLDEQEEIEQIFLVKFSYSNALNEMMALSYLDVIANISVDYDLPVVDLWNATYLHWDCFYDHAHLSVLGAQVVANEIDNAFGNLIYKVEFPYTSKSKQTTFHLVFFFPILISNWFFRKSFTFRN